MTRPPGGRRTLGGRSFGDSANSYDWQFVPEAGKTFTDSGTGNCH